MKLRKPSNISDDGFMNAKWDEITAGRDFKDSDIPNLVLLCAWHKVIDRCLNDLTMSGELQVAYSNSMDDIKELPQIGTMKKATDAIRALNKQLHIEDEASDVKPEKQAEKPPTPLKLIQGKYRQGGRVANA